MGLTTQLGQIDPGSTLHPLTVSASSSTKPTLMARMLADLHAHPGHRVLEIGTGTGYHAALLCHRLGQRNVCSVDIHPGLIDAARTRLANLGHHPLLACIDGADGWVEHAPYDRIIATWGISTIPYPWVAQTRPGGLILAEPLAGGRGMLIRLTVADDGIASGHFLEYPGLFMALRRTPDRIGRPTELPPERLYGARHAQIMLDPAVLADPAFSFFCQLYLGSGRSSHHVINKAVRATVVAHDGSWAEATGGGLVTFDGTHNPWETVETTHETWTQLGQRGVGIHRIQPFSTSRRVAPLDRDQVPGGVTAEEPWNEHVTGHCGEHLGPPGIGQLPHGGGQCRGVGLPHGVRHDRRRGRHGAVVMARTVASRISPNFPDSRLAPASTAAPTLEFPQGQSTQPAEPG